MNKAGLFGGGWEDYLDALNDAFDRHVAENAPPHPFGASVDAIMTGYPDTPQNWNGGQGGVIGGIGTSASPAQATLAPADQVGGPSDADGRAGNANLVRDANGNPITKAATTTDNSNSGATDQLTAFRNLMASPTVEGRRNDVYPDSLKIPTVGIGHKVVPSDNLRVGDVISDDKVNQLFAQDGSKALDAAKAQAAQAGISDPEFIAHLASVNFQLGTGWTRPFSETWGKIAAGDYAGAADNLSKSKWAKQTPVRVQQFQSALLALPPKAPH